MTPPARLASLVNGCSPLVWTVMSPLVSTSISPGSPPAPPASELSSDCAPLPERLKTEIPAIPFSISVPLVFAAVTSMVPVLVTVDL